MYHYFSYLLPLLITASLIVCAVVIVRLSLYLSGIKDEIIKSNEIQTRMLDLLKEISASEKEKESTFEPKIASDEE
jgi:hypothetical protein